MQRQTTKYIYIYILQKLYFHYKVQNLWFLIIIYAVEDILQKDEQLQSSDLISCK